MTSSTSVSNQVDVANGFEEADLDRFAEVGSKLADAAGEVIRKYFRKKFDILDKEDLSEFLVNYSWLCLAVVSSVWLLRKCREILRLFMNVYDGHSLRSLPIYFA